MFIVLLGPPGAGKGTQAQILASDLGLAHVATGNLLREAIQRREPLGIAAKGYLDRGELAPDLIISGLLAERLNQPDARPGVIFDGYPRTVDQARELDRELTRRGRRLARVIAIGLPDDKIVQRLSNRRVSPSCGAVYNLLTSPPRTPGICDICGDRLVQRNDDRPEVIRRRLEIYANEAGPLTAYYRERGVLAEVQGDAEPMVVAEAVRATLPNTILLRTPEPTSASSFLAS